MVSRCKKALFGCPSTISVALICFYTYVFFIKFIPLVSSAGLAIFLSAIHSTLAILILWSLLKTLLTNPGYLPQEYNVSLLK